MVKGVVFLYQYRQLLEKFVQNQDSAPFIEN